MPEPLAHEGEAHELLVLVAVANDEMVGALRQREHSLQLRLGPALEPDARRLAEGNDLLHHVALLVDLDRIDRGVAAVVLEFLHGGLESRIERFDARTQDVGEPEQHGERDALRFEISREFVEVERAVGALLVRANNDMPLFVDVEETVAPTFDIIKRTCGGNRPSALRHLTGSRRSRVHRRSSVRHGGRGSDGRGRVECRGGRRGGGRRSGGWRGAGAHGDKLRSQIMKSREPPRAASLSPA